MEQQRNADVRGDPRRKDKASHGDNRQKTFSFLAKNDKHHTPPHIKSPPTQRARTKK